MISSLRTIRVCTMAETISAVNKAQDKVISGKLNPKEEIAFFIKSWEILVHAVGLTYTQAASAL